MRKQLDKRGRCCGRKPIVYKRDPHLFCCRCNASFNPDTGKQIENWAYKLQNGTLVRIYHHDTDPDC